MNSHIQKPEEVFYYTILIFDLITKEYRLYDKGKVIKDPQSTRPTSIKDIPKQILPDWFDSPISTELKDNEYFIYQLFTELQYDFLIMDGYIDPTMTPRNKAIQSYIFISTNPNDNESLPKPISPQNTTLVINKGD